MDASMQRRAKFPLKLGRCLPGITQPFGRKVTYLLIKDHQAWSFAKDLLAAASKNGCGNQ
jgi:hypothetical protein